MKYLYIVLDGAGDRTYKELDNKSPLDYAHTPNLDFLASKSCLARVEVVGKNIAPESDSAVLSLLGYDVKKYYPGRGVIEAIGAGMKITKNSIYFRANFATINDKWELVDIRAGRICGKESRKFVKDINKIRVRGAKFEFKQTYGYRGVLKVTAKDLSHNITGNHNGYQEIKGMKIHRALPMNNLPVKLKTFKPRDNSIQAKKTSMLMKLYVKLLYNVLKNHPVNKKRRIPANMLLLRGAGAGLPKLESMKKRTGLNWAALVEAPVEEGICRLTGMGLIYVGKESDSNTVKTKKYLKAALNNMRKYDALYIHIKGPDLPGHDGELKEKIKIFEIIDTNFFKPLLKNIDLNNTTIIVTADHSTECGLKAHTQRPTPLLLYKPGKKSDGLTSFSEKNCSKGSIGTIQGKKVVTFLK